MERLTEKIGNTNCVKGCGSNCKYGFQYCSKEDWENCQTIDDVVDKLADYEDLEEQGRLVILPCKVGDTVYLVQERIVEVPNVDLFFLLLSVVENRFNNSVFLTKSEAEAKLKELRGGENE